MSKTCSLCDFELFGNDVDGYVGFLSGDKICFACCRDLVEFPPEANTDISVRLLNQSKQRQFDLHRLIRFAHNEDLPTLQKALRGAIFLEYQMLCASRWDELQRRLAAKKNIWA